MTTNKCWIRITPAEQADTENTVCCVSRDEKL